DFSVGFPMGITVKTSDQWAFDLELVPSIQNDPLSVGLTVHPGIIRALQNHYAAGLRMAFDVNQASWGFTPLLNKAFPVPGRPYAVPDVSRHLPRTVRLAAPDGQEAASVLDIRPTDGRNRPRERSSLDRHIACDDHLSLENGDGLRSSLTDDPREPVDDGLLTDDRLIVRRHQHDVSRREPTERCRIIRFHRREPKMMGVVDAFAGHATSRVSCVIE